MTEPGSPDHGYEPAEETPEEVLKSAPPFPRFADMVIDDLTEEEDRVFLETILNT